MALTPPAPIVARLDDGWFTVFHADGTAGTVEQAGRTSAGEFIRDLDAVRTHPDQALVERVARQDIRPDQALAILGIGHHTVWVSDPQQAYARTFDDVTATSDHRYHPGI